MSLFTQEGNGPPKKGKGGKTNLFSLRGDRGKSREKTLKERLAKVGTGGMRHSYLEF